MSDFERPTKNSAKDVIDYEIEMFEHCAERLRDIPGRSLTKDQLAMLEAFLLHFRILLEFFGEPNDRFHGNLYFQRPGTYDRDPSAAALKTAADLATALDATWGRRLDKFLAHPTSRRYTEGRTWHVRQMRSEMVPLIGLWRQCWEDSA